MQLEYDKGSREFEVQEVPDCTLSDLDADVVREYSDALGFTGDFTKLLLARGFASNPKTPGDAPVLRVAGALLFAKDPATFLPSARIRFIRYEGVRPETGPRRGVIKQETIEGPLARQIKRTTEIVRSQLRDFSALGRDGLFVTVSEYPEFAWQEGIVNAVTHRAYRLGGLDIQIRIFDDRLEIESPGRLPGLVRLHNIKEMRYFKEPPHRQGTVRLGVCAGIRRRGQPHLRGDEALLPG